MPNYAKIPDFGQLVEFVTQAEPVEINGELVYGVVINQVRLADQDVVKSAESLLVDYEKVAAMRPIHDIPSEEVEEVKIKIAEDFHSDVVKIATVTPNPMEIVSALSAVKSYPAWRAGIAVSVGTVYLFAADKNLYQVIQAHTTQATWTPVAAKPLFKRYYEPGDDPWPWVQPTGAHDAYPLGAKVRYNGNTWQSTIANNVWAPGVTGWNNLTNLASVTGAWAVGVAYKVNDQVTYSGNTYRCLQAHTSQAGWTPTAVPALWAKV